MKKKNIVLLSTLIASSLALSACSDKQPPTEVPQKEDAKKEQVQKESVKKEQSTEENAKPTEKTDEEKLKEYIDEQEQKITSLTEEVDYYKEYVKDITLTLSPEKLQELINKEWNYSITINSVQFPKNGILEIGQGDFELIFEEERVPYSVLPEEESLKGKLPKTLSQSISVYAPEGKASSKNEEEEQKNIVVHSFKGLLPDEVVKVTVSEELMAKLNMSSKELEIRVTK